MEAKIKIFKLIKDFHITSDYLRDTVFMEETIQIWLSLELITSKEAYLVCKCIDFLLED